MASGDYVLLVDDDPAMTEMYKLGLESQGFHVTVLHDAARLSDQVESQRPDIVVLDWDMPGVRGDEALERLRQTGSGRDVPVFMLSNFPGTRDGGVDRAFRAGAIAWLEKVSTTPAVLAVRLREALDQPRTA
ncbi:MAG TPA: response regulator [Candidatus Dormibacteraeota bacterium]|nr:response regulator [Candidatus Dormibacteraeota bacterium]